jgi:hypothetical protein
MYLGLNHSCDVCCYLNKNITLNYLRQELGFPETDLLQIELYKLPNLKKRLSLKLQFNDTRQLDFQETALP